jgi:hypothetical protein
MIRRSGVNYIHDRRQKRNIQNASVDGWNASPSSAKDYAVLIINLIVKASLSVKTGRFHLALLNETYQPDFRWRSQEISKPRF